MSKNVKDYFEEIAYDFNSYYEEPKGGVSKIINAWLRRPGLLRRLRIALEQADPKPGRRIIDIGCGSGKFVVECAKKGSDVHGLDISNEMIEIAKRFSEKNNVHITLQKGDATKELPTGFDVCVALGVFEYFKDPLPILRNMFLSINDGGKVIFSVPSSTALQTPLRMLLMRKRKVKCYYYTKKKARSLIKTVEESNHNIHFFSYGPGFVVAVEREDRC